MGVPLSYFYPGARELGRQAAAAEERPHVEKEGGGGGC